MRSPPGLIPPPEAISDAMDSIRIATIKNEPRKQRMSTESKRQAAEANRAKFLEQRRAAKLANWNKRQPKGAQG